MNYLERQCRALLLAAVVIVGAACVGNVFAQGGTITDKRDGKTYKTVKIGKQTWTAQNLNFKTKSGSWCYGNKDANCAKYGRLYNWEAAKEACPEGWHLPAEEEWDSLVVGSNWENISENGPAEVLRAKKGWNTSVEGPNGERYNRGYDSFGFSALPGGNRNAEGGFEGVGDGGNWWTATEDKDSVRIYGMHKNGFDAFSYNEDKSNGYSVRCVKD